VFRERYFRHTRVQKKYGNQSKTYNGITYHSKKEAKYAQDLDLRIRANDIKSWERQVKIDLRVKGIHICNYYIDFVITHNDGILEYVEVKGFETPEWRLKWKLFEAIFTVDHPEHTLTVVK